MEFAELESNIKNNKLQNSYVFYGMEEQLIKENIKLIADKVLDVNFKDLNYVQFDGMTADMMEVINTCETMPFMSERKVVVVYRATFLREGEDREDNKKFEIINKYLDNVSPNCILILYYAFEDEREKASNKMKKLEKKACVVRFDKLKGAFLEKKVKALFDERGKDIGKLELKVFCDSLDNNLNVIINEVEKLCSYTYGREITKEDIKIMAPVKTDNDIFDLVDALAQKRPERALDLLNELVFKGEKIPMILFMVERQFKLLLNIKRGLQAGKNKDILVKELKLNPWICEKMIGQSKKFALNQLKDALELCLNSEQVLKSSSANDKTEMELLIINTVK